MKTKEEILEEIFNKPETQDWYKPVLKAMETYAQQLRQYNVVRQSELLLEFAKYAMPDNYTPLALNNIVKTFLEEHKQ